MKDVRSMSRDELVATLAASERALREQEDRSREAAATHRRLEVLDQLSSKLSRSLVRDGGVAELLAIVLDEALALIDAEHAAVGIGIDPARPFAPWVSRDRATTMSAVPHPAGLLGEVVRTGRSLRMRDVKQPPTSGGFPPTHSEITSFVGAVVSDGGGPIGHLYMANRRGSDEFSESDQQTLELLANRAGLAIEIARLSAEVRAAVAMASHDLRNPLANIILAATILASLPHKNPLYAKQVDVIRSAAAAMRRLTDDLSKAASIEAEPNMR
jgi:GAF domain-containing protein